MIIIIQCAGSKQADAGMLRTRQGKPVKFVAAPPTPVPDDGYLYTRPDGLLDHGSSWREMLVHYNTQAHDNPLGLLPACELYRPPIYQRLVQRVGRDRLFILSAGWGLIGADFLTPDYDITFSAAARGADSYKRRRQKDHYADFCMLPLQTAEPMLFFGGKDYLPLFLKLTRNSHALRTIFYTSALPPVAPGCRSIRFETTRRTNWHYSCAEAFLDGNLEVY